MDDKFKNFEPYHWAWLRAHLYRSPEWLSSKLKEGFDVHHLDGDHKNNDPVNLVLIECTDHMHLHGGYLNRLVKVRPKNAGRKKKKNYHEAKDLAEVVYNMKLSGKSWGAIARKFGIFSVDAISLASKHAYRIGAKPRFLDEEK